jgi:hypothetical protein
VVNEMSASLEHDELKATLARFTEEHLITAARAKTWEALQVIPTREVNRLQDLAEMMVHACLAQGIKPFKDGASGSQGLPQLTQALGSA